MLNYANLNDVEFECLCQDIMSKKLGVNLHRFAPGRDGGIDLADSASNPTVIVQVKHYTKTSVSGLISALKKEIKKVEAQKPKQYYVCCSKELTPRNISDIYAMFSDYMASDKNIITLNEIEDFLTKKINTDILKKHYKLWISSTNILEDIYNNAIFVDCEALLSSIHTDKKYFVQTAAYNQALSTLSKHRVLFLTGSPGVGKTVTSKMLILHYAALHYRVRFTTDVTDLASLKKSLTQAREQKEVILLDDCFGQAYFEMKNSQGDELLSLIKFVNSCKNKILILNSRVTIYQEARMKTPELIKSLENKEFNLQVIDMSAISNIDKAKILYNHMYFSTKNDAYFQAIKNDKRYRDIIHHKNYNPRIIEFIANPNRYAHIPPEGYYTFVIQSLSNPHTVWDNEYNDRLQMLDRCLLMTLYSLSNGAVPYALVEACFTKRVEGLPGIDTTINQFQRSLARLQESFVQILDDGGRKKLAVANPSINDYLRARLASNPLEFRAMLECAIAVPQYQRLLSPEKANAKVCSLFKTGKIESCIFENDSEKTGYIVGYVADHAIMDIRYKKYIRAFLEDISAYNFKNYIVSVERVLAKLFQDDLFEFYKLSTLLSDPLLLEEVLSQVQLDDLPPLIQKLYPYFAHMDGFVELCQEIIRSAVEWYCDSVEASDFSIDIGREIRENTRVVLCGEDEYDEEANMEAVIEAVENKIANIVADEISSILDKFPGDLKDQKFAPRPYEISVCGVEDLVYSYAGYGDKPTLRNEGPASNSDIDWIFNR